MTVEVIGIQNHHLKDLHRWEMDEELQVKTGVDVPRTLEQFCQSYDLYFKGQKPNLLLKAIEVDGELIGKIELFRTEERDYIGMVVAKKRGHGIGTKALTVFLEMVYENYDVQKIFAEVYEDNVGSLRFFQKNGFESTGEHNEELFRGKPRKLIVLKKELD